MNKLLRTAVAVTALGMAAGAVPATAADPVVPLSPHRVITKTPPKSDLTAGPILAQACKCDLADADALYMNQIKVRVGNQGGIGIAASEGTLRVTYFDLAGNMRVVTKPVPRIEPGHHVWIVAVNHPIIVKKSSAIIAEVISTTLPDTYSGNNAAKADSCSTVHIN